MVVAGCGLSGPDVPLTVQDDPSVTVASFNFPESQLLGEIYAQALEAAGVPVRRELDLGPREVVAPALEQGIVDVLPEYTGTALAFLTGEPAAAGSGVAGTAALLARAYAARGARLLSPAPAENQNGLVVTGPTALAYGLATVSDLVAVAGALSLGGPPECPERPFCLPGLERVYGLRFERFVPLDSGGRLTLAALVGGDVDVGLFFSTDGNLASSDLVLLDDDRSLQPAENVVPVVREEVFERHGAVVADRLDAVSAALTTEALAAMNGRLAAGEATTAAVAADWLEDEGLLS